MANTIENISGYCIIEQVYDGIRTKVYRGIRSSDRKPVVLKLLKAEYPTFNQLVQFRHQYAIAKSLNLAGIIQSLSLENYGNSLVLVMEDFGGISLKQEMERWGSSKGMGGSVDALTQFFHIAIQIAQTLEALYHKRIIHKDIKPDNILINPQTREVKLIDFSISSLLPKENQEIQNPNVLEGTLAYISPEQTGRMNRGIDYRTDFYSLGVTFYELLTGQLPFNASDPMELVHCHIARKPKPPIELVPAIPQMVNDIVIKLMAKTAEERYQTAFGLRVDLENCWQQWQKTGSISQFALGMRDISERFVIPEKLYGRETEVATLLAAFDRVSTGATEMMLVAGFSGIGKTAAINEVHKPIVRQRGYFIKGKFDQFKRDIPFSSWVQAFQDLMRQLLSESSAQLEVWKAKILEALGENAQVVIEVIPELEKIIGKQPAVAELEGSAAQNRFNVIFEKFIRVFTTKEHPLVIFLDDLQWADSASLKLIQLLLSEASSHHLLLMGAYRDNEVYPAHPLILTLEEIRQTQATVNQITLAPLDETSLNTLIADTLSCPPERAILLAKLVLAKTQGNPFFTNQFLKFLHQDGLISFDFSCGYWQCDIARVRVLAVSSDVVEFMASQLQKLPEATQTVLKLAACIGNQFDLATLAIVHEKSQVETAVDLWGALQEGLIIPISEVYNFFHDESVMSGEESWNEQLTVPYKFLHDRVQQAAYFLIPDGRKQLTHLKIGQLLLKNTSEEERDEKIFEIVNQLNYGVELISEPEQRDELAQLNLIAGRKAKASTAYAAARGYLTVGMEFLAANPWDNQYELTRSLYVAAAEVAYLDGDFSEQEKLADVVLQKAHTLLDKVKVYEVNIQAYTSQNKLLDAIDTALTALGMLGVTLPKQPDSSDIQQGLEETALNLGEKNIESLIYLPEMTEPYALAAMSILSSVISPAYFAIPALFPIMACKQVTLSLKYGNTSLSAHSYVNYAIFLCGVLQDIDRGYQFGELALRIIEKFDAKELKAKVFMAFFNLVRHWKKHPREGLKFLLEGYQSGIETGDLQYAGYAILVYCYHPYLIGKELINVEREMAIYRDALSKIKQETALNFHRIYWQTVLNMLGRAEKAGLLKGEAYDEEVMRSIHEKTNDGTSLFLLFFNKVVLNNLFYDYSQAVENSVIAEQYLDAMVGSLALPTFYLHDSIARLGLYPDSSEIDQERILTRVASTQEKMKKWAEYAPMNHLHKFYLIEAERYRILGENVKAMDYYDQAIAGAKDWEYTNEEALANELAAKLYLAWGKQTIAQTYLINAYYAYARWGAKAKVDDLEQRYPQLLAPILAQATTSQIGETIVQTKVTTVTSTSTSSPNSNVLDLATVIKASQALSGEIQLDKLLSTLMQVAIENAGAEKGILILSKAGNLAIEATVVSDTAEAKVLQSIPIEQSQAIPVTLINYVYRTSETLVIDDATAEHRFSADPYIIDTQPRSVLCTPLVNRGQLIGIFYLENNLTARAFTPDRLEVLKILSAQAAISIENAQLYQTLEYKVQERTAQLAQANEEISTLNKRLRSENLRMSAELEVTKQLQQMVLPKAEELNAIEGLEITGFMEPASEVGGDYYDVVQQNGKVKISIGDVTGHGLESGVLMLMAQTAVRTLQESNQTDPVQFLAILNRTIYSNVQRINSNKNLTLALLEYAEGTLNISGQHEEIIVVRAGGQVELIDTTDLGFPIGLDEEIADFIASEQVQLNPGDVVVLYTDGITEAFDINRQQYGRQRLCEIVRLNCARSPREIMQAAIDDLRGFIGEQRVFDDITLVVFKRRDEDKVQSSERWLAVDRGGVS